MPEPPRPLRRLALSEFIKERQVFHFARTVVNSVGPFHWHTHEYDEIFIIESGAGLHHINHTKWNLVPGDMVFMRAEDRHTFSGQALGIANLSFPTSIRIEMASRLFGGREKFYGAGPNPRLFHFDPGEGRQLVGRMECLQFEKNPRFALELFLLQLMGASHPDWKKERRPQAPPWLERAVAVLENPAHFRLGSRALALLTQKSPEHLSRSVKKYYGTTPTDLVNHRRLSWAAAMLTKSDQTVLEIALECGFESQAYFYKLFTARFQKSPQRYRQQARRILGMG